MFELVQWGIFGLILGSFTNVLILREGTAALSGRSFCPHCKRTLEWFELIPVVSWLFVRGKCRTCQARISLQYPLVEILVALGVVATGLSSAPFVVRIVYACIIVLLVAILVYDLRYTIIPDAWSYSTAGLALLSGTLMFSQGSLLLFLLSGPLVAFPLAALWFVSKGKWMGLGDPKLALSFGWLLGIFGGYVALCIAFVTGALVSVFVLIPLQRLIRVLPISMRVGVDSKHARFTMTSEVPFGPFLIFGLILVWFSALYQLPLVPVLLDFLSLS